jgi:hypothetical protein
MIRMGRGRNLRRFISEDLNPLLRGWANYFRLAETKGVFEDLDQWIRRKLRCNIWRQWKKPKTRFKALLKLGFTKAKARKSAYNGSVSESLCEGHKMRERKSDREEI